MVYGVELREGAEEMKWLSPWWYQYLFSDLKWAYGEAWYWPLKVIVCRIKGHPRGWVYYNPGGMEPDYSCKDCGDEIG